MFFFFGFSRTDARSCKSFVFFCVICSCLSHKASLVCSNNYIPRSCWNVKTTSSKRMLLGHGIAVRGCLKKDKFCRLVLCVEVQEIDLG